MEKVDSSLPEFLQKSIRAYIEGEEKYLKGGYYEFDMDYCELQADINSCEVDQLITSDEAWRLREKYLGLERPINFFGNIEDSSEFHHKGGDIFHVHTYRCGHATNEPDENYIKAAVKLGASSICFTDHAPFPGNPFTGRMKMDQLDEYMGTLGELKERYKDIIDVHIGLEVEYLPSFMEYYEELRNIPGMECMVLGQHHYEIANKVYNFQKDDLFPEDEFLGIMTAQIDGVKTGLFDVIAHPDRCFRFLKHTEWNNFKEDYSKMLIDASIKNNVILEKNLASMRNDGQFCKEFWNLIPNTAHIITGCDAHSSKNVRFSN